VRRLLTALFAALALAAPAQAANKHEITAYADRLATVWAERQSADGRFLDPHRDRPSDGYGNVMIGYALLRAGERSGDEDLIRAGVRGVSTALGEPPDERGVFDLLAFAAAYNFARESLPEDPIVEESRGSWEAYLAETGPPNIENKAERCISSGRCFHNHEAVGAAAILELLGTEVNAPRLGRPEDLVAEALTVLSDAIPRFSSGSARIEGERPEEGLGLLSDTGSWPLAYHALSTAMLARSLELLADGPPGASREALERTAHALAGFMAPDGAVAYIGRRQENSWALAATMAATQRDAPAAADRAFRRLEERYPITPKGQPIVPRTDDEMFYPRGFDGRQMPFNGLTLYLLNVAADMAPEVEPDLPPLPADSDGAFVDPEQLGFAAVRHGDVWFVVHRRADPPDLRNDFGLVAAKWHSPAGDWVDIVRPRPYELDRSETAGPVVERDGRRIRAGGGRIALRAGGGVRVEGRIPVDFTPTERGVRIALDARAGDTVTYTQYLPIGSKPEPYVRATPAPAIKEELGFTSCCDVRMVAARLEVEARQDGPVVYDVGPPPGAVAAAPEDGVSDADGPPWWPWAVGLVIAGAFAALLYRRLRFR
jgi:hypothetical protein